MKIFNNLCYNITRFVKLILLKYPAMLSFLFFAQLSILISWLAAITFLISGTFCLPIKIIIPKKLYYLLSLLDLLILSEKKIKIKKI